MRTPFVTFHSCKVRPPQRAAAGWPAGLRSGGTAAVPTPCRLRSATALPPALPQASSLRAARVSCRPQDTFTDPLGSETLVRLAEVKDKTYVRVGKGLDLEADIWHALTFEPGHELVFARALAWIEARVA